MQLKEIKIQRYRSIMDLTIKFNQNKLDVICGSNNVGKTNILRAIDLFFSMDVSKFNPKEDIPYHIRYGSVGGRDYTKITGYIYDESTNNKYEIEMSYRYKNKNKELEIKAKKNQINIDIKEAKDIIKKFKFIFIESSNIDIPTLIKNIFKEKALTTLDTKRKTQKDALELLKAFQEKSNEAIQKIEGDLTAYFKRFLELNPIFKDQVKDWNLEVKFPTFDFLREAISEQIQFTLNDSNNNPIETKGSGIQKIILISLINYVSDIYNQYNVIWGIDEPEAFLQPLLQKNAYNEFKKLSQKYNIIITTHSNFFIDIADLSSTMMVEAEITPRTYARRPGVTYLQTDTKFIEETGYLKFQKIKEHLGIERNDSWEIHKQTILTEGETDKKYLETLLKIYNLPQVRIVSAGGADNMAPLLELWNSIADDIKQLNPVVLCLLDHDAKGKEVFRKIDSHQNNLKNLNIKMSYISRYDGDQTESFEYAIEDLLPVKIIINELDKWISKEKKYKKVTLLKTMQREQEAYNKTSVLKFYDEKSKSVNPDKIPLKIYENKGIKSILCKNITKYLLEGNYAQELDSNTKIKEFLEKVIDLLNE